MERNRISLEYCIVVACVLLLEISAQSLGRGPTTKQIILTSKKECFTSPYHYTDATVNKYRVSLELSRYKCNSYETGFQCSQTFAQNSSSFANVGTRLCVDVQGVQYDIRGINQLRIIVSDKDGELKRIYSTTRLKPENSPYYVCARPGRISLTVAISVRQSVSICPHILDYMFSNVIRMGTVMATPPIPIAQVNLAQCYPYEMPHNDSFLVKVYTTGSREECAIRKRLPQPYSYTRGCLTLVDISRDFECPVKILLFSEGSTQEVEIRVDQKPGSDEQQCDTFPGRYGQPILAIKSYASNYIQCKGEFAFRVDFRQTPSPGNNDDSSQRSPNLYMAVFITLIAICLVCLGLTCLCCIRFRAKRLRRLQQRNNNRQGSFPNQGFQFDVPSPQDFGISWSPTEPGTLFGLPTYDDVVGGQGVNPSDDPHKDDLPPSYESVFASSENDLASNGNE